MLDMHNDCEKNLGCSKRPNGERSGFEEMEQLKCDPSERENGLGLGCGIV